MGNDFSSEASDTLRKFKSTNSLFGNEEKKERLRRLTDDKLGYISMDDIPPEDEVDEKFEKLMQDLSLPEDKVEVLRVMPIDSILHIKTLATFELTVEKWKLMKQHQSSPAIQNLSSVDTLTGNLKSHAKYIESLIAPMEPLALTKELVSLEVALRTLPLSWVEEFIEMNGLDFMLIQFREFCLKQKLSLQEREVQRQYIRCFSTIMNNSFGLRSMMRRQDAINILILGYDCDNIKIKAKLLELAGGISLILPDGQKLIMDAFTNFQLVKLESFRFQSVVTDFYLNDLDFQTSAMAFISAFVNTPEELDLRISLRFEFLNLGIKNIIQDLRSNNEDPELQMHLDTFELEAESDFAELAEQNLPVDQIDFDDPDEVFHGIKASIVDPDGYQWLLRLLQQIFTLCNSDERLRAKYLQTLWTLANEVTLQRNALRLRYHVLNFNIQKIIEGFANEDEYNSVKTECLNLQKQVAAFGNDIQAVQSLLQSKEDHIHMMTKDLEETRLLSSKLESDMKAMRHKIDIQAKTIQDLKHGGGILINSQSTENLDSNKSGNSVVIPSFGPKESTGTESIIPSDVLSDMVDVANEELQTPTSTVPPPPPPSAFAPPPPPPPGAPTSKQPEKSRLKVMPSIKMKQMNWSKVNTGQVQKTVWSKFADNNDEYVQNQLDFNELESLFGISERKERKKNVVETAEEKKTLTLLDSKKSYALSILLSRVRLSLVEIRLAVLQMSEEKLSESLLKQLQNYIPTPEEQTVLSENLDSYDILGKPEQFYVEILKISRYEQRLMALNFKRKFQEKIEEIQPAMECILKASAEVKTCRKLHQLLEIILTVGNFMNGTSFRGNASGFQIEMLSKLSDIKTNQKTSFMNYLCVLIDRRFPELANIPRELQNVEKAAKVSLQAVIEDFNELKAGLTALREELPRHKDCEDPQDRFFTVVKSFLDINMPIFIGIDNLRFKMEQAYSDAISFYNEDPKISPESFFLIFSTFIQGWDKARKENEREEEIKRKAEHIKSAEIARLESRQKKQQEILSNDRGVMDELISSLKTGTFIAKTSMERRQNKRMSRMIEKPDEPAELLDAEKLLMELRAAYTPNK